MYVLVYILTLNFISEMKGALDLAVLRTLSLEKNTLI